MEEAQQERTKIKMQNLVFTITQEEQVIISFLGEQLKFEKK